MRISFPSNRAVTKERLMAICEVVATNGPRCRTEADWRVLDKFVLDKVSAIVAERAMRPEDAQSFLDSFGRKLTLPAVGWMAPQNGGA